MLLHPFGRGSFTSGDGAFLGGQIYEVGMCSGVYSGLRSGGSELGRGYPIRKGRGIETSMVA